MLISIYLGFSYVFFMFYHKVFFFSIVLILYLVYDFRDK